MREIKEIYSNLSGVQVDEQVYSQSERAKGYIGEFEVLSVLLNRIEGNFKVLMNLNIPINGKSTEIDVLMIHETGIYVFEVKNYKGIIYGTINQKRWTQYFRTVKNHSFHNPVLQNDYHIQALRLLGMNQPMYSVIVFTNDQCQLKIEGNQSQVEVATLSQLALDFNRQLQKRKSILELDELNRLFNLLKTFTVIKEPVEVYEAENKMDVHELINQLQGQVMSQRQEVKDHLKKVKRQYRRRLIGICSAVIVLSALIHQQTVAESQQREEQVQLAFNEMKHNFTVVDVNKMPEITVPLNLMIESMELKAHELYGNGAMLSFQLTNQSSYSLVFTEETSLLVMQRDGQLKEYSIYSENKIYNPYTASLYSGQTIKLGTYDLLELNSEISWIKLSNLKITTMENYKTKVLTTDYQHLIYEAEIL